MSKDLEGGPELDAAVARAITPYIKAPEDQAAFGHKWECAGGSVWNCTQCTCSIATSDIDRVEFEACWRSFSTDLNAAFEAAEKCGLFLYRDLGKRHPENGSIWTVRDIEYGTIYAQGPTPAVAICRAILKLKGVDTKEPQP